MGGDKFGPARKREERRARKVAEDDFADAEGPAGEYVRPPRGECEGCGPFIEAVSDTTRLCTWTWMQGTVMTEFVLQHFVQLLPGDDGWYQLARADCADGSVHVHEDDEGAPQRDVKHLRRLDRVGDVAGAYDEAYSEVHDRWSERERRLLNVTPGVGERKRPTGFLPSADSSPGCDG